MGFREGAFATVWEVSQLGRSKFPQVRLSVSYKDKNTGEYMTDFTGFVTLFSNAGSRIGELEKAIESSGHCRIKLGACDVSNKYDKEAEREYTTYKLFNFLFPEEVEDDSDVQEEPKLAKKTAAKSAKKPTKAKAPVLSDGDEDDEDLPF